MPHVEAQSGLPATLRAARTGSNRARSSSTNSRKGRVVALRKAALVTDSRARGSRGSGLAWTTSGVGGSVKGVATQGSRVKSNSPLESALLGRVIVGGREPPSGGTARRLAEGGVGSKGGEEELPRKVLCPVCTERGI